MTNKLKQLYKKIIVGEILDGFTWILFLFILFHFFAFIFILIGSFEQEKILFPEFWLFSLSSFIFYIAYYVFYCRFADKNEKYIKQLSSEIELNSLGNDELEKIFEYCLINQDIDNIMENISIFEVKYSKFKFLHNLFTQRKDNLEILKNEKLIEYINQLEHEEDKYYVLCSVISNIDEKNLLEYYPIIHSLFKNDSNIAKINSIKYKSQLIQETELKEKSIIIHI